MALGGWKTSTMLQKCPAPHVARVLNKCLLPACNVVQYCTGVGINTFSSSTSDTIRYGFSINCMRAGSKLTGGDVKVKRSKVNAGRAWHAGARVHGGKCRLPNKFDQPLRFSQILDAL